MTIATAENIALWTMCSCCGMIFLSAVCGQFADYNTALNDACHFVGVFVYALFSWLIVPICTIYFLIRGSIADSVMGLLWEVWFCVLLFMVGWSLSIPSSVMENWKKERK